MIEEEKLKSKGVELLGQKRLSTGAGLKHQSGMAKAKKNAAAVALGRLGAGGLR